MNSNQKLLISTEKEYADQIKRLWEMIEQSNGKLLPQCSVIMRMLQISILKLQKQKPEKYLLKTPAFFRAMLQPHIEFLEITRATIEGIKP